MEITYLIFAIVLSGFCSWLFYRMGRRDGALAMSDLPVVLTLVDHFIPGDSKHQIAELKRILDRETAKLIEIEKARVELQKQLSQRGFIDMGLTVLLGWGVIAGAAFFGLVYEETQTRKVCTRDGTFQIGNSLYECKRIQTLGERSKTFVIERLVEKPVPRKCPTCKPQKPCETKEEKKNPMCIEAVK